MDDKTQKERLEQELRFLKESFEAEVINKEEFEKGKNRIEKKLKEDLIESKTEEKIKLNVIQDEAEENQHFESAPIQVDNTEKKAEETSPEKREEEKPIRKKFFFKKKNFFLIVVFLLFVIFFSYYLLKDNKKVEEKQQTELKFVTKEIVKTNVIVLNEIKDCFNCNPQRVLNILENWLGAITTKEVDYNTNEGKDLADKFDAKMLPMYILEENITRNPKFEQFKQIFVKRDDSYVLSEDVAASTLYINRDKIPIKLDFFIIPGDNASLKAEKNLKEFLEVFKEVKFEKHLSNDKLAQELRLKTFPAFLVNNQVRFSGVLTAETIKENFCKMNKMDNCEKSLSMGLI